MLITHIQIYDFLVVFPPQERVLQLVKSQDKTEQDMLPMEKPYSFLYSLKALSVCLREEALKVRNESLNHYMDANADRPSAITKPGICFSQYSCSGCCFNTP